MKPDEADQQAFSAFGFAVSQRIAHPFHPLKKSVANWPKPQFLTRLLVATNFARTN
jgi:hypothetical protein